MAAPRAARAAPGNARRRVIAIAVTLAVLALGVILLVVSRSGYEGRRIVSEAIAESQPLRQAVEEFHRRNNRLPTSTDIFRLPKPAFRAADDMVWDSETATLTITVSPTVEARGRFAYMARPGPTAVEWECRAVDLDTRFLPAACR